jgi:hypothetical protein
MSLYTLAKKAVTNRETTRIEAQALQAFSQGASGTSDAKIAEVYNDLKRLAREDADKVTRSFTKYIPTESIALYLAVLPAIGNASSGLILLVVMAILTPLILVIVAARVEQKQHQVLEQTGGSEATARPKSLVLRPQEWPFWKMFGALVGFVVWALAIPGNPALINPDGTAVIPVAITSAAAVVVSYFLTLIEGALGWEDD